MNERLCRLHGGLRAADREPVERIKHLIVAGRVVGVATRDGHIDDVAMGVVIRHTGLNSGRIADGAVPDVLDVVVDQLDLVGRARGNRGAGVIVAVPRAIIQAGLVLDIAPQRPDQCAGRRIINSRAGHRGLRQVEGELEPARNIGNAIGDGKRNRRMGGPDRIARTTEDVVVVPGIRAVRAEPEEDEPALAERQVCKCRIGILLLNEAGQVAAGISNGAVDCGLGRDEGGIQQRVGGIIGSLVIIARDGRGIGRADPVHSIELKIEGRRAVDTLQEKRNRCARDRLSRRQVGKCDGLDRATVVLLMKPSGHDIIKRVVITCVEPRLHHHLVLSISLDYCAGVGVARQEAHTNGR